MELTEEYKVVADNMKSLEASEAVALAKEESFEEIIRDLTKDSRMPRPAPARARSLPPTWPKILRLMRKTSQLGWTNMPPSTARWRPPTTGCPATKTKLQDLYYLFSHSSFVHLLLLVTFTFISKICAHDIFTTLSFWDNYMTSIQTSKKRKK